MLNTLLYTFILYHILFLIICDAFMCVHCIVFYSSATEALINNNTNNNAKNNIFNTARYLYHVNRYQLKIVNGMGTRQYVNTSRVGNYVSKLRLPSKLTCRQCVLQWKYHAGRTITEGGITFST